ncbi:MAG: hypothetical protein FWH25_01020 [Syntrophorhabdaceae bacterium]|nr:hypothetical protein [Syntrophorhabdaceae bacterium]
MSMETEALWISLRDLALEQKAAVEAGNLEEAEVLGEKRRQAFLDIQKNDASFSGVGKLAVPEHIVREISAIDEEAVKVLKTNMREVSQELENINTFKVLFQGAIDSSRSPGDASVL